MSFSRKIYHISQGPALTRPFRLSSATAIMEPSDLWIRDARKREPTQMLSGVSTICFAASYGVALAFVLLLSVSRLGKLRPW